MSATICLGIDMGKASFHAAVLKQGDNRASVREFANSEEGFEALREWLEQQGLEQVHGCMEATSLYGHALATDLHTQGCVVSIVNPTRVKGYGQSQLRRTKNDRADAKLIAQFCRDIKPAAWQPSKVMVQELQAFTRRLEALERMVTQEKNRLDITPAALKPDIEAHIQFLKGQMTTVKSACTSIFRHRRRLTRNRNY